MTNERITLHIQQELTRLVGIAELSHDTASVEAIMRAKQEIAGKAKT